ncbi:hypothetical protein [Pseudactinotalea sp.]|uniref:hypothetical protein n=1 Tax=Pseudactinotalea sp. TaxID=1926260 RepID=UPI003B3B8220
MLRRALAVLAAAATALTLGGCGSLRLETGDPPAPSAGSEEQLRQEHAVQTQRIVELAQSAAESDPDLAPVLAPIAEDAMTQLGVLGGVWRPSGRHLEPATARGDAAAVETALRDAASSALEASLASDSDLASLFAGLAVSRALRADQLAAALGTEPGVVEPATPSALDPGSAADLIRTLDALGQAWEIVAARADDADQARVQAQAWRGAAQQAAELAGVADTPDDPRAVSYDLDATDLEATIADLESDLMPLWLEQVPTSTGDDRRTVVDLALTAARAAGLAEPGADIPAVAGR